MPVGKETVLRVNAGTGFKLPSFYSVSNPLVGNPDLQPEKARTIDVGIERQFAAGRGSVELTGFASRFRDGIDFDPGPPPRLVNRSEIRSDGVQASVRVKPFDSLELRFAGTWADIRSEPGGGRLRGRPGAEASARAVWRVSDDLTLRASVIATGRTFDSSVPTGNLFLPSWRRVDLAGRYRIRRGLVLIAAVDNLFDTRYVEAVGMPSPGVRIRGGIEFTF